MLRRCSWNCIWGPVGHLAILPSERSCSDFVRIPVSVVVGVGDEIGGDEQKEEKWKSGMPRRDLTTIDEMTFDVHSEILSHTHVRVKVRACTTSGRVHGSCYFLDAKLWKKKEKWKLSKTYCNSETRTSCTSTEKRVTVRINFLTQMSFLLHPTMSRFVTLMWKTRMMAFLRNGFANFRTATPGVLWLQDQLCRLVVLFGSMEQKGDVAVHDWCSALLLELVSNLAYHELVLPGGLGQCTSSAPKYRNEVVESWAPYTKYRCGKTIEVFDPLISRVMLFCLSCSVQLVVLPSVQYRLVFTACFASLLHSSVPVAKEDARVVAVVICWPRLWSTVWP